MLPQTDAPHTTLINNWIDINICKRWINFTVWLGFIVWTSFYKNLDQQQIVMTLRLTVNIVMKIIKCNYL